MEVRLDAQSVHLDQHLGHEQTQEDELCIDYREKRKEGRGRFRGDLGEIWGRRENDEDEGKAQEMTENQKE